MFYTTNDGFLRVFSMDYEIKKILVVQSFYGGIMQAVFYFIKVFDEQGKYLLIGAQNDAYYLVSVESEDQVW